MSHTHVRSLFYAFINLFTYLEDHPEEPPETSASKGTLYLNLFFHFKFEHDSKTN